MIYDELIEELALTLLTKARYEGCISVIDGFSQCEEDKTRIEYPIDGVIAQLKSLFKDDWEGIIGNCDTLLYLGGNEYGTYEYLSKILGKETERTKSQSIGKGSRGSSSDSLQTAGRELCMPDEIRRMRDDECLLLMRSEDPVIDKKYNLLHHPNVKYTSDAGGEPYVMPPDYMGDAVTITMGAVAAATAPEITEEMYEQLDYLEKHPEENYYENEENFSQYDQGD